MGIFSSKYKEPIVCDPYISIRIDSNQYKDYEQNNIKSIYMEPPNSNYYEPDTVINILKYRSENTDTKYASVLLPYFNNLPINIQNNFNSLTDNLMACNSINRDCLLNAIRDFEDTIPNLNDYQSWIIFTDTAFYYNSLNFEIY
jgi:hypothetical protein